MRVSQGHLRGGHATLRVLRVLAMERPRLAAKGRRACDA